MIDRAAPIVIFGAGSIGERHIDIWQSLGFQNIWVYRQRLLPLRNVAAERVQVFTELSQLDQLRPAFATICTPTAQHLAQTLACVQRGIPVLVEKPLAHQPAGIDDLLAAMAAHQTYVQVAYMLRFHPLMQRLKSIIETCALGRLLSAQTYWGEYLPDWHPWEDYRTAYAARRELGGGVALTLSHDLDLVNWLADQPLTRWHTTPNYRAHLDLNVEAGADVTLTYANGTTAHCHLNFYERVPHRHYRFVFDDGTVEIDYFSNEMRTLTPATREVVRAEGFERNQMFRAQAEYFLAQLDAENRLETATQNIREAAVILEVCNHDRFQ